MNNILSLIGAAQAAGAEVSIKEIGPGGEERDLSQDELRGIVEGGDVGPFRVTRDSGDFPVPHNHPLAGILAGQSPFNGVPSGGGFPDLIGATGLFEHKTSPRRGNPAAALAGLAALAAILGPPPSSQGGPDYRIPRNRGPRRLPWEPSPTGCGNPECPIHGNRKVPSTPEDRGAVLTLSGAIEVEADYSEDPNAKDWIAWVRENYNVGYVRCGKCGAVTRVRYWNEFDLHDCVRKLPCLRCGAKHTQVTVDGDPDNE